jgi:16S rRNA G527 N7-methylase RsmG
MVLVESRERKCAFLREVVRSLALSGVEVANTRFETLTLRTDLPGTVDLVSFRAVKADDSLLTAAAALLKPNGRVLWFGAPELAAGYAATELPEGCLLASSHVLLPATDAGGPSRLAVVQKRS